MGADDPHRLERFVRAQERIYPTALAELTAGDKRSHWMWFVFPQMRGLGLSPTAQEYGIASLDEARAYLAHPVLGPRLRDCTTAVLGVRGRTLAQIFGAPDDMKFRSSMTLFGRASEEAIFRDALERYCDGRPDEKTLALLDRAG